MYNEVTKDLFAAEMISTQSLRGIIRNFFDSSEKFEKKYNKDIAEFDDSQAREFIDSVDIINLGTIYQIRSLLMAYLKWCVNNQVFGNVSDSIVREFGTTADISEKVSRIYFKDGAELYQELETVYDLRFGNNAPPLLAFAWLGIDKTTAYTLKDSCVDLKKRIVRYEKYDKEIHIDDDYIYRILKMYSEADVGFRENKSAIYEVYKDKSSDLFLKNYYTKKSGKLPSPCSHSQLDSVLNRCCDKYVSLGNSNRFTYTNVWESGRLNALYHEEKAGLDISSENNREYIYNLFYRVKPVTVILFAYRNYKKAFNL